VPKRGGDGVVKRREEAPAERLLTRFLYALLRSLSAWGT
jgi:hypothetical protein